MEIHRINKFIIIYIVIIFESLLYKSNNNYYYVKSIFIFIKINFKLEKFNNIFLAINSSKRNPQNQYQHYNYIFIHPL